MGFFCLCLLVSTSSSVASVDFDKDGIADIDDDCPTDPGIREHQGCPGVPQAVPALAKDAPPAKIVDDAIVLPTPIRFKTGSATMEPESRPVITQLATLLTERLQGRAVRIEGHTDSRGRQRSNQRLSQARAEAVVAQLVRAGIERTWMSAKGFGSSKPITTNGTAAGRAKNRRVELHVVSP